MRPTWTAFLLAVAATTACAADPIPADKLDAIRAVIIPQSDELKWTQIRWHADLWEARTLAAAQGKPILMWEMDGHPLGCT